MAEEILRLTDTVKSLEEQVRSVALEKDQDKAEHDKAVNEARVLRLEVE